MLKPKVFSLFHSKQYPELFPGIRILHTPFNFFLECASFDVMFPTDQTPEQVLNIFEETVLKILDYKKGSPGEVAETLCLEKDFVNYIIIRLKELHFLDENLALTADGHKVIEPDISNAASLSMVPGKVFVNKETGDLLPYIHIGGLQWEDVDEFTADHIRIQCGSAGKATPVRGRYLRISKHPPIQSPTQQRLRQLIRTYNKIRDSKPSYPELNIREDYHMEVSRSEDVVLHLQAVIQHGMVEKIIVSNGFVKNCDTLSKYLSDHRPELVADIKRKATEVRIDEQEMVKNTTFTRYSEIYSLLTLREIEATNADEKRHLAERKLETLKNCYAAIEWAFHYHLRMNPLPTAFQTTFATQSGEENRELCLRLMDRLGIQNGDRYRVLVSNLDGSKLRLYDTTGQPHLYTVWPMAVAEAAANGESPFHSLIQGFPNILYFLWKLNRRCNTLRHEAGGTISEDVSELFRETCTLISLLLPDFHAPHIEKESRWDDWISQERLNGDVRLGDELGVVLWEHLDRGIKDELLKISPNKSAQLLPTPYEYVLILSRVTESYLYQGLSYLRLPATVDKDSLLNRVEKACGTTLPGTLRSVGAHYIAKTLEGRKGTLGAYVLLWLGYMDSELAHRIGYGNFIELADKLCSLRKHGNNVNLSLTVKEQNALRDQVLQMIRIIGGYYG